MSIKLVSSFAAVIAVQAFVSVAYAVPAVNNGSFAAVVCVSHSEQTGIEASVGAKAPWFANTHKK